MRAAGQHTRVVDSMQQTVSGLCCACGNKNDSFFIFTVRFFSSSVFMIPSFEPSLNILGWSSCCHLEIIG